MLAPGELRVVVYLDGARSGGVTQSRQISARMVTSIEFLDAAAATYRREAGPEHGAVLVRTGGFL